MWLFCAVGFVLPGVGATLATATVTALPPLLSPWHQRQRGGRSVNTHEAWESRPHLTTLLGTRARSATRTRARTVGQRVPKDLTELLAWADQLQDQVGELNSQLRATKGQMMDLESLVGNVALNLTHASNLLNVVTADTQMDERNTYRIGKQNATLGNAFLNLTNGAVAMEGSVNELNQAMATGSVNVELSRGLTHTEDELRNLSLGGPAVLAIDELNHTIRSYHQAVKDAINRVDHSQMHNSATTTEIEDGPASPG